MFQGAFTALVTPFKDDLEIDFEAYGRLIDYQLEQGINGLVPCGCTGEAATLSHDEQKSCIRFTVERVAGRVPVVAGTGSNNTQEALSLTKYAADIQCDGALLITPYYNKPTAAGQIAHYKTIAEAVDIPIMLYNVPGRTGIKMEPQTVATLSEIPQIVAIKEAAGSLDQVSHILSLCNITVLSGDDSLTLPMMAVGAKGVVSVASNVAPEKVTAMCRYAQSGNYSEARELHYKLLRLFKAMFLETNPMPVKAALAKMGIIKNNLRLPLVPMAEKFMPELESTLKGLHLV